MRRYLHRSILHAALVAVLLTIAACGTSETHSRPVSAADALPVARALVASIASGNHEYFNTMVDSEAFINRAAAGLKLSPVKWMVARATVFQKFNVGDFVATDVQPGGHYTLLRLHTVNGETRALVRVLTPGGILNYHDIIFGYRPGTNDVAVVDVFVYGTSDLISRTYNTLFKEEMSDDTNGGESRMMKALSHLAELAKDGKIAQVNAEYAALTPEQRRAKLSLALYLMIARSGSAAEFDTAMTEYMRYYPRDTGAVMLRMESAVMNDRPAVYLATADTLAAIVGGDPYLDQLRGLIIMANGDSTRGMGLLRKAIAAEPAFEPMYWPYVDMLILWRRFPDARQALLDMERNGVKSHAEIDSVLRVDADGTYKLFLGSKEYREWVEGG